MDTFNKTATFIVNNQCEELKKLYHEYIDKTKNDMEKNIMRRTILKSINATKRRFMDVVINHYKAKSPAQKFALETLDYAVNISTSGNGIVEVPNKQIADEVICIVNNDFADYLLDTISYQDGNVWLVDCLYGGAFIPEWDGTEEWLDEKVRNEE